MAQYLIQVPYVTVFTVDVVADSVELAIEIAQERVLACAKLETLSVDRSYVEEIDPEFDVFEIERN